MCLCFTTFLGLRCGMRDEFLLHVRVARDGISSSLSTLICILSSFLWRILTWRSFGLPQMTSAMVLMLAMLMSFELNPQGHRWRNFKGMLIWQPEHLPFHQELDWDLLHLLRR